MGDIELTRPIIGIENRTPQEVFDIMCDRIARSGLEARKAEESMRERAAKLVFDAVTQEDSAQVANKLFNLVPAIRALPLTGVDKP